MDLVLLLIVLVSSSVSLAEGNPRKDKSKPNNAKHPSVNRSLSCHFHGNDFHPRNHALKSQSDANLGRLVLDKPWPSKNATWLSPRKNLNKSENRDSVASMRSLNSLLSMCEGVDIDFVEDDSLCLDNEVEEYEKTSVKLNEKLPKRCQSVASDVSVNSLLSLLADKVEEEPRTFAEDCREDDRQEEGSEATSLRGNERCRKTESPPGKRKRRTGKTISVEKSQSGRVSSAINPLRSNNDVNQTSHCNVKGVSVSEVMRNENMITQVQFY